MSKFANTFLKTLNEENETKFIKAVADAAEKGKKTATIDGKTVPVKMSKKTADKIEGKKAVTEKKLTPGEKKERNKIFKGLPKKDIEKRYGKDIRGAIATKVAMKEAVGDEPTPAPAPEAPADDTAGDEAAWKASLDKNTNPDDFNVDDNPQLKVDASGVEAAMNWIKKLEDMAYFVNDTGPESLNSQINQLELKNSIPFRGVVRREEKRITKLAENLRGLAEVFKSVVIGSQKKVKDATTVR